MKATIKDLVRQGRTPLIKQDNTTRYGAEVSQLSVPYSVRATQEVSNHYIVDIWDSLDNLSDIEDLLFVLGVAKEEDRVTIHLNCSGGSLAVGDAIMLAMNNCEAEIHIQASGLVASFATFILLNCDSFEISPHCVLLCHSASFGAGGKMAETKQQIDFMHAQCEKMLRYYYEGFLTEEEITRIIEQGYEHWMTSEEFCERFKKMVEYKHKKLGELQQGDEDSDEESDSPCSRTTCTCKSED